MKLWRTFLSSRYHFPTLEVSPSILLLIEMFSGGAVLLANYEQL